MPKLAAQRTSETVRVASKYADHHTSGTHALRKKEREIYWELLVIIMCLKVLGYDKFYTRSYVLT